MALLLLIWAAAGLVLAWLVNWRGGSAGLPLAYFLGLSLIHVPGAVLHYNGEELNAAATKIGFEQTIIGIVAFVIGTAFARTAGEGRGNPAGPMKDTSVIKR